MSTIKPTVGADSRALDDGPPLPSPDGPIASTVAAQPVHNRKLPDQPPRPAGFPAVCLVGVAGVYLFNFSPG